MNKFIRLYNQNRFQVWIIVIIVLFLLAILQLFNSAYREQMQSKYNSNTSKDVVSEENTYEEEGNSLISDDKVEKGLQKDFGKLIDDFLSNCINEEYDLAYDTLSKECKTELFPSKEIFIDQYCSSKFTKDKDYEFQAWSTHDIYIYLVKIYNNMLATGKKPTSLVIQDYYTIVKEDGEYKLNINGYIGRIHRNKKQEVDGIKITADYSDLYMDYEIYSFDIKNKTENDILLDTTLEDDTVYVVDENGFKYNAFMFECLEEDLVIKAGEQKNIKIKFSNNYNEGIKMKDIVFAKIVEYYDNYKVNDEYVDYLELKISL